MIKKSYALLCGALLALSAPAWSDDVSNNPTATFNFDALQKKIDQQSTQNFNFTALQNKLDQQSPKTFNFDALQKNIDSKTLPETPFQHAKLLEKNTPENTINAPSQDDVLRKQKISTKQNLTEEDLLNEPEQLEKIFALNLAANNPKNLPMLRKAYAETPDPDTSLLEWADAMTLAKDDVRKSVRAYRSLLAKFPDNNYIRFQLANLLYQNQEFESAKIQFEKLRAQPDLKPQDVKVFDSFLAAIAKKDKWNFSVGATFLNDKNLNDSADVGTRMVLANGSTLTQNTPKEKGTGFNINTSIDRQWSFEGGKYTAINTDVNLKYYWNNKAFNELSTYVGGSLGYMDARIDAKITPFAMKRWYGGGDPDASHKLKSYTQTVGVSLSGSRWHTHNLKQFASYSVSREKYHDKNIDSRFGGVNHSVGTTFMYLNGAKQYFGAGVDLLHRTAGQDVNAYDRYNTRVFWGQEWPLGFSTSTNVSVAKRQYKDYWLGIVRRKNTEWNASVSIWHKAVHFKGITPRLTFQYHKTKSNIPIFSYDKKTMFVEMEKSF